MKKNYLDIVPRLNSDIHYFTNNEKIIIFVKNKGVFNKTAQLFFGRPRVSKIYLDEKGSLIWNLIDGKNSIYDIANNIKAVYGESIEPLYPRLFKYMSMLNNCKFIVYEK